MVSSGEEVEHGWMEGALGSSSAADELVHGSGIFACGLGRLGIPTRRYMSFYSGCYRSFIPEIFTTSIAYHVVVHLHTVHDPCSKACILPATAVACRPYPCEVDRTIADSSMLVSGRLRCVGSAMLEI
ncbi:hypothetical protein BHM03_00059097 [Ensete ventricosum]|nr:hypothetical protein BHM03_00059097 [Ensete ventricosum]